MTLRRLPAHSIILVVGLVSGCIAPVVRPAADVTVENADKMDWSDWAAALAQAHAGGTVDYGRLTQDRLPLQRTLARFSKAGPYLTPAQFPDQPSRLAYAINCYDATILDTVVQLSRRTPFSPTASGSLEFRYRYAIDGRLLTPADLRREALALGKGDWRVPFALCDAHRIGPPLPRHPFQGELLDGQLNESVRAAIASDAVVRVSHGEHRLLLWKDLYSLRGRLVQDYETRFGTTDATILDALLEWSDENRRFTLNSAIGYDLAVLPDDHQLNHLAPPAPETKKSVFSRLASFSLLRPAK